MPSAALHAPHMSRANVETLRHNARRDVVWAAGRPDPCLWPGKADGARGGAAEGGLGEGTAGDEGWAIKRSAAVEEAFRGRAPDVATLVTALEALPRDLLLGGPQAGYLAQAAEGLLLQAFAPLVSQVRLLKEQAMSRSFPPQQTCRVLLHPLWTPEEPLLLP